MDNLITFVGVAKALFTGLIWVYGVIAIAYLAVRLWSSE